MKNIMLATFLILITVLGNAQAGEVTGAGGVMKVLKRNGYDIQALKQSGHEMTLGEVTGAGKLVPLDQVRLMVTKKQVINANSLEHVQFQHPSQARFFKEVEFVEFNGKKIPKNEFIGLIIKK